ncbi:Phosphoenolpyruvate/pyruvate domain-containing protein [Paraphaeosphaeria sporulosa]|uniref:Phosphoenolpyruvate/pyruvate domain-containing protein n=1 Tax=Paraphaeosphaeria sporulosa TaxID=1460663 RepID=A0A177CLW3_9PLEO|nr:Phosphoenolpyruvate/pyruvate domain-containing protein [Paraphaeosphaeria sporulosa]OAG08525.1 Phosphoenolpyruvate/pyruvate domain-containing protein [Paraphaeosphaeria sporulosa]
MTPQPHQATALKALHTSGQPLILTNIWDAISARAIASLPQTAALATASYAIACAAGLDDDALTLDANLRAAAAVAVVAREFDKPLTVDFQDGYGDALEEGVRKLVALGAVGINLEDFAREKGGLYDVDEAVSRIKTVLRVAGEAGVPDFVVNARTDALLHGRPLDEAIARGRAYLDAGATTAFIWGGRERGGTTREEVERMARELGGRLNVILVRVKPGGLTIDELRGIGGCGVARISVGPQLMLRTTHAIAEEAEKIMKGEGV